VTVLPVIWLPSRLQQSLEATSRALLRPKEGLGIDFGRPLGEAALASPDSVSWRIFKNPVALLIGGIAAVILELAEPAVRAGVWEHSSFRNDPMGRLRRTGLAAMVTVYGARSVAEPMIAGVVRIHHRVRGVKTAGVFAAVANYGLRPTVEQSIQPRLEVHLLGECPFGAGDGIKVEWLRFLRPEKKFAGLEQLQTQIAEDRTAAAAYFRHPG